MATLIEPKWNSEFIATEANGYRSRDNIVLTGAAKFNAGDVLGQITAGAAVAAAVGGNTGNGTSSAVVTSAGVQPGVYHLIAGSATEFTVESPTGVDLGVAKTGVAFSGGGLTFTLTAGGTPFVAGDAFTITVAAGSGSYTGVNVAATDGSSIAVAILGETVDATSADVKTWAIVRSAEVNGAEIAFGTLNAGQITAATAQLKTVGIIVRPAV